MFYVNVIIRVHDGNISLLLWFKDQGPFLLLLLWRSLRLSQVVFLCLSNPAGVCAGYLSLSVHFNQLIGTHLTKSMVIACSFWKLRKRALSQRQDVNFEIIIFSFKFENCRKILAPISQLHLATTVTRKPKDALSNCYRIALPWMPAWIVNAAFFSA